MTPDEMTIDDMIEAWHRDLKERVKDRQTVRDYMRSLTLYRADLIRAATDLDDSEQDTVGRDRKRMEVHIAKRETY